MGLCRVPADAKSPADMQKNVTVFTAGDNMGIYATAIQEVQTRETIYDVQAKRVVKEGGLPRPVKGSFAGWEPLAIPAGKYEYKVYVGDVLVAVFPFEVR